MNIAIFQFVLARSLAREAHQGQFRTDGTPYVEHPQRVADSVGPEFKAAAMLHDVLEDTEITEAHLRDVFPARVVDPVVILTRRDRESYARYIRRIADSRNPAAIAIKIADLNDNLSDHPPGARRDKYELAKAYLEDHSSI